MSDPMSDRMSDPTTSPGGTPAQTPAALLWREYAQSRTALASLALLAVVLALALLAPWVSPQNPYDLTQLDILDSKLPPGSPSTAGGHYLLGTDDQGRDMLSGIFYGLRSSLLVGTLSTVAALGLGVLLGLTAAYFGGWVDALVMRVVDLQLSFPAILLALILLAIFGQGLDKVIIALVAIQWALYARTVRASAMVERDKDYMQATRVLGLPRWRQVLRHLLPNCLPPLIVVATVQVAHAISLEATLSFFGLGLPITEPSLGLLISNGFSHLMSGRYWISFYPGVALLLTILSINLVADRLRDILNPRLRR
jgi:peptide/nickel transport system permease protein